MALQKAQAATNLTSGSCGRRRERERPLLSLVSFEIFLSSPCMQDLLCATGDGRTCFLLLLLVMGLDPWFCVFCS